MTNAVLYQLSIGRAPCYDEIGFVINTLDPVGYRVQYLYAASEANGTLRPLTPEDRLLQITIMASAADHFSAGTSIPLTGNPTDYEAIQTIAYAGDPSGHPTFVLRVRGELAFSVQAGRSAQTSSISVHIAHPST